MINLNKVITLTGHKNCGKYNVAMDLAENSDVAFIKPYTDREIPLDDIPEEYGDFHYVSKDTLDLMIEDDEVLSSTMIDGNRYVFFKFQLTAQYNVLIADDYGVVDIKSNWGDVYSVKVYSDKQIDSDRVGVYLYDHEFDEIFHYGLDDVDELEWRIGSDECTDK